MSWFPTGYPLLCKMASVVVQNGIRCRAKWHPLPRKMAYFATRWQSGYFSSNEIHSFKDSSQYGISILYVCFIFVLSSTL